ncbi:MAG: ABC transporter permease [Candidatus Microsaccharimonas sossegonensis]|uniref:Transport permease protein n=1 Tax=Candidatus Microsaccharimonas sossegonensis TaxID=2506948 RepID=A0A4Q0AGM1_9BACT|nr:MAG: ABC transporter permease [Candidatus Microsaccharimonas sossegonensis]
MNKPSLRKQLYTVGVFARSNTRRFFRDRLALFFTIVFPLIFLFVFGSLNNGSGNVSFNVAVINQSNSQFATDFVKQSKDSKILKVNNDVTTLAQAKDKMSRSELDAAIILPKDFGTVKPGTTYPSGQAEVMYTENNQSSASALTSVLTTEFKAINDKLVTNVMPFTVKGTQLNEKSLTPFDYTFAGLLGFSLIGMGIFGPVNVFPELKKMGILRRLSTTPLRVWQYFLSTVIGQAAIGIVSFAALFIVAILVFKLHVVGNWLELGLFLLFGMVTILGIGLALGGWAKNERQAAPLSNIIVFPMLFLSGTFFPRYLMPDWLQNISAFLPLTPIIDGIRLIATEGKNFIDILPQIGLTGAWLVVIYIIAFRVFRWE